jgi:hypothetical protein
VPHTRTTPPRDDSMDVSALPIILGVLLLADLVVLYAASRAPRGYEDESGFHWGRRGK